MPDRPKSNRSNSSAFKCYVPATHAKAAMKHQKEIHEVTLQRLTRKHVSQAFCAASIRDLVSKMGCGRSVLEELHEHKCVLVGGNLGYDDKRKVAEMYHKNSVGCLMVTVKMKRKVAGGAMDCDKAVNLALEKAGIETPLFIHDQRSFHETLMASANWTGSLTCEGVVYVLNLK